MQTKLENRKIIFFIPAQSAHKALNTHGLECDSGPLHTRDLRARDHYTSGILIGGKGGAGPSSLHTTLEGPIEYVDARWM